MVKRYSIISVVLPILLLSLFCSDNSLYSNARSDSVNMATAILWKKGQQTTAPDEVDSIRITVTAPQNDHRDTVRATFSYDERSGTIAVPDVDTLTVFVEGLDATGTVVYRGVLTVENTDSDYLQVTVEASQVSPLGPTDIVFESVSTTAMRIQWSDISSNEDGFIILRGTDPEQLDTLTTVSANQDRLIDTTVEASGTYYYQVLAFNSAGESEGSQPMETTHQTFSPHFVQDTANLSEQVYIAQQYQKGLTVSHMRDDSFTIELCTLITYSNDSIFWEPHDSFTGENRLWAKVNVDTGVVDSLSWTVTVIDTIKPELTINGLDTILLALGDTFIDPSAEATDNADGDISDNIEIDGHAKTDSVGVYTLAYTVSDGSGNESSAVTRTIIVSAEQDDDITPPVITIEGKEIDTIDVDSSYSDSGATALDNREGDISDRIETTGHVDTAHPGVYEIAYFVSDTSGNDAEMKIRTIYVLDRTPPVIELTGEDTVELDLGDAYSEPGYTVSDNYDQASSLTVIVNEHVDSGHPGTYSVSYDATDSSGNHAEQVIRTVYVVDNVPPLITLLGKDTVEHEVGNIYTDPGASATDNYDEDISELIDVNIHVDTSTVGTYQVIYNVEDSVGNRAEQVSRLVRVVDQTVPVITLLGEDTVEHALGATYSDSGAVATDNYDGDISELIEVSSHIDTSTVGTYEVVYNVEDSSGNCADQVVRIVKVVDRVAPVITLLGEDTIELDVFDSFTDPGAEASDNNDGDISDIIAATGEVDTDHPGIYLVTYSVEDSAGNQAEQAIRTVIIRDSEPPEITLIGQDTVTIYAGFGYAEQGATATDNYDSNLTSEIQITGSVNANEAGTSTLQYTVSDSSGNTARAERVVICRESSFNPCQFNFGADWDFLSSNQYISVIDAIDYATIWIIDTQYENSWHGEMLNFCEIHDKTPVLYSYIITTTLKEQGLNDCDVDGDDNLCTDGAQFIRENRVLIIERYQNYAMDIASVWGTDELVIFLMEPDYFLYASTSQSNPLSFAEAGELIGELIDVIKYNLPNAVFSMDISPWMEDQGNTNSWYSAMPLEKIHFNNTSGGRTQADASEIRSENTMTWQGISEITGKGIISDCGYGMGGMGTGHDATWDDIDNLQDRIADGVIAITQRVPDADWGETIADLRVQLADEQLKSCGLE